MKKCILAVLFFFAANVSAQTINTRLDSLFNYCHKQLFFNGTVLIADSGQIIFEKAFGNANEENKVPNKTNTRFRLGSVSKQFTAYIIMKLVSEGKLSVDSPAFSYLGHYEKKLRSITIKNLLTHTSGLRDYTSLNTFDDTKLYAHNTILQKIIDEPSLFPSGSNYRYSNSNFFVLALIAEKVSGKNFETVLSDIILDKAGMNNSGEDNGDPALDRNMALGYVKNLNKLIPGNPIEMRNTVGGGGMYSTANDLYKWSQFFQNELSSNTTLKKFMYRYRNQAADGYYSCGWFVNGEHLFHEGHINGFANLISIDTVRKQTIIILSNSDFKYLFINMMSAQRIMTGDPDALRWTDNKPINYKDYLGKYQVANLTAEIKEEKGRLVAYGPTGRLTLRSFGKDGFFFINREGFIVFKRDAGSNVVSLSSFEDYEWVELKKTE